MNKYSLMAIITILIIAFGLYILYDTEKTKREQAEKRDTISNAKELALKNAKEKHNEAIKSNKSLASDTVKLLRRLDK